MVVNGKMDSQSNNLPPIKKRENYYAFINWQNGFENWKLLRIFTIADGSCLFHAICNSFFKPYDTEMLKGENIFAKRNS